MKANRMNSSWTCHSCGHQQRIEGVCIVCGELLVEKTRPTDGKSFCRECRTIGVGMAHVRYNRCFTKTVRRRMWGLKQFISDRVFAYRSYEITRRIGNLPTMIEDYIEIEALFSTWHRDKRREVMDDPYALHDLRVYESRRAGARKWEETAQFRRRTKQ